MTSNKEAKLREELANKLEWYSRYRERGQDDDMDKSFECIMQLIANYTQQREDAVTRFEVIDHRDSLPTSGRAFTAHNISTELSYQDDGRTLKVFVTPPPLNNKGENNATA